MQQWLNFDQGLADEQCATTKAPMFFEVLRDEQNFFTEPQTIMVSSSKKSMSFIESQLRFIVLEKTCSMPAMFLFRRPERTSFMMRVSLSASKDKREWIHTHTHTCK